MGRSPAVYCLLKGRLDTPERKGKWLRKGSVVGEALRKVSFNALLVCVLVLGFVCCRFEGVA